MGLAERFDDQRNRTAVSRALPYLDTDEEIVHWVRVRHRDSGKEGFAYVTERRLLLRWQGRRAEGHQEFRWEELEAWGIQAEGSGGPKLCVEAGKADAVVELPARSRGVAKRVTRFLGHFSRRAPKPRRSLETPRTETFEPLESVEVTHERPNAIGQTKRIIVTVLGVALILFGVALGWLPLLPFWLPVIAGFALLASEYDWAKDFLDFMKDKYAGARDKIKARRQSAE